MRYDGDRYDREISSAKYVLIWCEVWEDAVSFCEGTRRNG